MVLHAYNPKAVGMQSQRNCRDLLTTYFAPASMRDPMSKEEGRE